VDDIPLNVTVLKHCRCCDCSLYGACPVAKVDYHGDGQMDWHYCRDYAGRRLSDAVAVMPRGEAQDKPETPVF